MKVLVGLLICVVSTGIAAAQGRQWIKWHDDVEFDEQTFGEYTYISTSDDQVPDIERFLYKDSTGALLVIRQETDYDVQINGSIEINSASVSVTLLATGEEMVITHDGQGSMTLTIEGDSITFMDKNPFPPSTRDQAQDLLVTNASQDFRDALSRLGDTGANYAALLHNTGILIEDLLFGGFDDTFANYTNPSVDIVKEFDPATTPPGAFEQAFGSHYDVE